MKRILFFLGLFLISLISLGQSQSVVKGNEGRIDVMRGFKLNYITFLDDVYFNSYVNFNNNFTVDGITYPNSFTLFENEYGHEENTLVRRKAHESFYQRLFQKYSNHSRKYEQMETIPLCVLKECLLQSHSLEQLNQNCFRK